MENWIVVVDDEPFSLTNAKNLLKGEGMKVSCLRSGADLIKYMEKNEPDLILLDIMMPEMDGFETYHALRVLEDRMGKNPTPVIFLTGENNSEIERRGLKAGASDFIRKPLDKEILVERINNTITNSKKIESLTEEASLDKLTGFLNKVNGTEKVASICKKRSGALMVIDLDNFKLVNDVFGHDMGDRVLVAFSEVVKHNVRSEDVVSRIGGDEFMIFFADVTQEDAVASITGRLNVQLAQRAAELMGKEHGLPVGLSVGVAFAPMHSDEYSVLFKLADNALYKVKQNGKHGYEIYLETSEEEFTADNLEHELLRISQILEERGEKKGALILGQEPFAWNYRLIMRYIERYGGVATKILFSLPSREGEDVYAKNEAFESVLKRHLRKSDIIFQYKPNLYFVLLSLLKNEDSQGVTDRIANAWKERGGIAAAGLECAVSTTFPEDVDGQ